MTSKPLIAVVIPSYNQGQFIRQTIDSVLGQTGVKVDVLVMDGGSSDQTVSILKSYRQKITWVSEKDKGQSDAINKGLATFLKKYRGKGEVLFAYLNSDDYYLPGAFGKVLEAFAGHPEAGWLVGECEIVDEKGMPIQRWIKSYKKGWRSVLSWPVLSVLNPIPQPAVVMRLDTVRKVGLFNQKLKFTMDYEYWLRVWRCVGRPLNLDQPVAAFRIHGQSKGSTQFERQFAEQHQVAQTQGVAKPWLLLQSVHNKVITSIYSLIK